MLFNSKHFPSIHHIFQLAFSKNLIAHAWILCAFRIEYNFDNSTKSSTILVFGSITPVKGGRNGRTSYRQVEPHPMDFPAIFKNGGEYFKTISKIRSSLKRKSISLSLPQGREDGRNFATITCPFSVERRRPLGKMVLYYLSGNSDVIVECSSGLLGDWM